MIVTNKREATNIMLKLKTKLTFLSSERKTAILSGYRPAFKFGDIYVTGSITLLDADVLSPGGHSIAEVNIAHDSLISSEVKIGQTIVFYEPPIIIGEAEILEYVFMNEEE